MSSNVLADNINVYRGDQARKDWAVDDDLYGSELEVIRRHFPTPPARIVDLGCGAGRTTLGLERLGFDVDAMDLADDLVDVASKRLTTARVRVMDARQLTYGDESFDAALFSFNGLDCVYPQRERARVLDEVRRVLKPGGVFYYSGHNALGALSPRPGDSWKKTLRRNRDLVMAQRLRSFDERTRYVVYPEPGGTQVLYSALPHMHFRELREAGLRPMAMYGSRSYRVGIHERIKTDPMSWRNTTKLARIAVTCPHVHIVAEKPRD